MSSVSVDDDLLDRVRACKPLVENVIEEELSVDELVAFLLVRALDTLLLDLLNGVDQPTLVRSFQLIAAQHPTEMYEFAVGMLKAGAARVDPDTFRQPLGFAARPVAPDGDRVGVERLGTGGAAEPL